ncbi:MAG TPA: ATP-binding cassette domain-containing protein [Mycobacteriales bacterium]|nr:ATP-binding cassette domain-containing protein [Mycobacteriales bacterium]
MSDPTYAIRAEGLVKRFGSTTALDGVDLAVPAGTVLGLLGPNGAGKTTTVRTLATLITPDAGRAWVGGHDVQAEPDAVRSLIGLTGQYAAVDEELTGIENLILVGRLLDLSRSEARSRARELLARFGLADAAGRAAGTFSGGMRRRLDLAVSLMARPMMLFLDEPTTGLDPRSRGEVYDLIRGLVADGVTVLLTTQYLDEADQLASSIVVIDHGRVIAEGTADELKTAVGGQVLEVRPAHRDQLPTLARAVADVVGASPSREGDGYLLTVPVSDPKLLTTLVRRLDDQQVEAAELALRRPSLDEVFLAITGHTADPEGTAA